MYNNNIKNAPRKIYLSVGLEGVNLEDVDFKDLKDVTWCEHRIFDGDIEYIQAGIMEDKPVDWEQVRINAAISIASRANLKLEGLINNYKNIVAKAAVELADALVHELKKKS